MALERKCAYTSLKVEDGAPTHIRLFNLLPGGFEDPIEIVLGTFSLRQAHEYGYEALSYVWGKQRAKDAGGVVIYTIVIKNVPGPGCFSQPINGYLEVTENLYVALRHLRRTADARTLWVDAICINQDDIPEKNFQVSIMGEIYSKASRTVVWLGPSDQSSEFVLGNLIANSYQDNSIFPFFIYHLMVFLQRPWFSRMWVVQEV
ncbi:HET-domain-containing protein, partial [Byssothecium circinans]